jgi:hypothetical protein
LIPALAGAFFGTWFGMKVRERQVSQDDSHSTKG